MTTTTPETQTTTPAAKTDERLSQARADVIAEIGRTDTKATALLTAFGIPLAVLVATVPGRQVSPAAAVFVGLGALGLVAAMLVVLLVIRPRLAGGARGSYLYWATCTTPEEILEDLATDRRAERIIVLSQIAKRKYGALRLAIDITAAAVLALALAVLVSLA
ncbi:Pycsar system effector family protein [Streptomyces sp. NPDC051546]|uniref:Pycsar system effector family protein n=1 Tax=Streptomyces sp. NPDC051546 TaxID=3365655 RepID=UPI0037BBF994